MIKSDRTNAEFAPPENTEVIRTDRKILHNLMRRRLNGWNQGTQISVWNSYCDASTDGDYRILELEWEELYNYFDSADSLVAAIFRNGAKYNHDYYYIEYGNLYTFDYLSDENSPYDPDKIIDALIDSLSVPLEEAEQEWLYRNEDEEETWGYAVYETADGNKMALRLTPFDDEQQERLLGNFSEKDVFGEEGDSLPEDVWGDLNEEPKIKHVLMTDLLESIGFQLEDSEPDLPWRERFDSGYAAAFCLLDALKRPCGGKVPCEPGGWYLSFDGSGGKNYVPLYEHSGTAGEIWDEVLGRETCEKLLDNGKLYRQIFTLPSAIVETEPGNEAPESSTEGFSP